MLKFHIIIIKFSIFTDKNSQSDTFFPKLKSTIVKIDIKGFSVQRYVGRKSNSEKKRHYVVTAHKAKFSLQGYNL